MDLEGREFSVGGDWSMLRYSQNEYTLYNTKNLEGFVFEFVGVVWKITPIGCRSENWVTKKINPDFDFLPPITSEWDFEKQDALESFWRPILMTRKSLKFFSDAVSNYQQEYFYNNFYWDLKKNYLFKKSNTKFLLAFKLVTKKFDIPPEVYLYILSFLLNKDMLAYKDEQ